MELEKLWVASIKFNNKVQYKTTICKSVLYSYQAEKNLNNESVKWDWVTRASMSDSVMNKKISMSISFFDEIKIYFLYEKTPDGNKVFLNMKIFWLDKLKIDINFEWQNLYLRKIFCYWI